MGVDPIWYATFGMNVFATKGAAEPDVKMEEIFAGVLPFLVVMVLVLVFLLVFPSVSTFLPNMVE